MTVHPIVRFAAQTIGALGAGSSVYWMLGITVTTSWLTFILVLLVQALAIALAAYAGARAAAFACDKLSDTAFEGYGNTIGSALGSVRNLFSRKAA